MATTLAAARRTAPLLAGLVLAATPAWADACPTSGETAARVAAVEPRLELRLDDGRRIRLVGIDPALPTPGRPDLDDGIRSQLAARIAGKSVSLRILSRAPDRWGRWPALAFATDADAGGDAGGLAGAAIRAGLARYLAEPAAHACRDAWLAAEDAARTAKLGLWADPYYGVLAVDDRAAFVERSGTTVLAQGQVRAVDESSFRTTLRFVAPDSHGGRMLVATVVPRVMKAFKAQGMDVGALVGRHVRLRGLLDLRFGPRIELAGPDAVEIVDAPPAAPAPPQ